jgi:hypothetical protein
MSESTEAVWSSFITLERSKQILLIILLFPILTIAPILRLLGSFFLTSAVCGCFLCLSILLVTTDEMDINSFHEQSLFSNRKNSKTYPWTKYLAYFMKYPWIFGLFTPTDSGTPSKPILKLDDSLGYCLIRHRTSLQSCFSQWYFESRRNAFFARLRLVRERDDKATILESAFLRFKANILIQQRNFYVTTVHGFREENEYLRGTAKADFTLPPNRNFDCVATDAGDKEYFSEGRDGDYSSFLPTCTFPHTASILPTDVVVSPVAISKHRADKCSDLEMAKSSCKALEGVVTKLEFDLRCKDTQLDVLKREISNLKKSLTKRISTGSVRGQCSIS